MSVPEAKKKKKQRQKLTNRFAIYILIHTKHKLTAVIPDLDFAKKEFSDRESSSDKGLIQDPIKTDYRLKK